MPSPGATSSLARGNPRSARRRRLTRPTARKRRPVPVIQAKVTTRMSELIHTCYRIGDIDRSVAFYEALGFEQIGRVPIRDEAINVFMGFPGDGARLVLTYNHGVDSYDLGTGY